MISEKLLKIEVAGFCPATNEPFRKKTNIVDSAAQFNSDRRFSPPVDFLCQESLLYTSIPLRRNVLARISLIWIDTLRRVHDVGFVVERLICA